MPRIDAVVDCAIHDSFRVQQVAGMFDLQLPTRARETFSVEIPGPDETWQIGLIVGPSGSGKTTVARAAFGEAVYREAPWPADRAVVDCLGEERTIKEITSTLTAVGFSSPPAWVKPHHVLSGGERFRCDLARALLSDASPVVFDEFTSVVDRTVAKIGSAAVARALRAGHIRKRFVAVTCHYDVAEWLEPDWVADMARCTLTRGRLRRPTIELQIFRCHHTAWRQFSRHHYLNHKLSTAAHCYLATWNNAPVAFCAVLSLAGCKGRWRISRIVVLPDYQGLGVGRRVLNCIAQMYHAAKKIVSITTSHPAMIAALRGDRLWRAVNVQSSGYGIQHGVRARRALARYTNTSRGRSVVSFRYLGS